MVYDWLAGVLESCSGKERGARGIWGLSNDPSYDGGCKKGSMGVV